VAATGGVFFESCALDIVKDTSRRGRTATGLRRSMSVVAALLRLDDV